MTNRSRAALALFLVAAVLATVAVLVGAWWFGSGRYGEIPALIAPGA